MSGLPSRLAGNLAIEDNTPSHDELLGHAAKHAMVKEAIMLIDNDGANVNARLATGVTPLMLACVFDEHDPISRPPQSAPQRLKLAEALLERNADVHAVNGAGWTPFIFATFYGQAKICERLLQFKAEAMQLDNVGRHAGNWVRYTETPGSKYILKHLYERGLQRRATETVNFIEGKDADLQPARPVLGFGEVRAPMALSDRQLKLLAEDPVVKPTIKAKKNKDPQNVASEDMSKAATIATEKKRDSKPTEGVPVAHSQSAPFSYGVQ